MGTIATIIHILVTLALIGLILMQASKGGLGNAFGSFDQYRTKRGAERAVFIATVVAAFLFLITSIVSLLV